MMMMMMKKMSRVGNQISQNFSYVGIISDLQ